MVISNKCRRCSSATDVSSKKIFVGPQRNLLHVREFVVFREWVEGCTNDAFVRVLLHNIVVTNIRWQIETERGVIWYLIIFEKLNQCCSKTIDFMGCCVKNCIYLSTHQSTTAYQSPRSRKAGSALIFVEVSLLRTSGGYQLIKVSIFAKATAIYHIMAGRVWLSQEFSFFLANLVIFQWFSLLVKVDHTIALTIRRPPPSNNKERILDTYVHTIDASIKYFIFKIARL